MKIEAKQKEEEEDGDKLGATETKSEVKQESKEETTQKENNKEDEEEEEEEDDEEAEEEKKRITNFNFDGEIYTFKERPSVIEEKEGKIEFRVVNNDNSRKLDCANRVKEYFPKATTQDAS